MFKKCYFEISPRQSGKTKTIIDKVITDLEIFDARSLIITNKYDMKKMIEERLSKKSKKYKENVFVSDVGHIGSEIRGMKKFNYIYIDEYLMFKNHHQREIYSYIQQIPYEVSKVEIYTSPYERIESIIFDIVKKVRLGELSMDILDFWKNEYLDEFKYLYYNFLTDPKTALFVKHDEMKKRLPEEKFETEYLGKLFKGE